MDPLIERHWKRISAYMSEEDREYAARYVAESVRRALMYQYIGHTALHVLIVSVLIGLIVWLCVFTVAHIQAANPYKTQMDAEKFRADQLEKRCVSQILCECVNENSD
jgi:hypothetical protein